MSQPPLRPSRTRSRFAPERLFRPESLVVIGAGRLAETVLANIQAAGFAGPVQATEDPALVETADLAILTGQGDPIGGILHQLAAKNIHAAVALGLAPDIVEASAATGVRVLGAGSFGVAVPALKLNATLSHLEPRAGRVALVSQSAALCRAVLDWAEPNGVGFSQIVGIGGNAGVGFAQTLDFLSRDPAIGPVLLDIRRVRNRRAFLSAARAAARLRPVIAIRAGNRLIDPSGRAEAVFDAALNRAGVLTVQRFEDLLAAAETLTRAPAARGEGVVIVTNAIGPGQMAADAALSAGIGLASLAPETLDVLRLAFPAGEVREIVYVGVAVPTRVAEAASMLAGAREVGGILAVFAPTGPGDAAGIAALAAIPRGKTPLLVCAMGETTGAAHRRALAEAGIPAFASPEQAVQGFRHLLMDRRARAAARELPSSAVLSLVPDRAAVARIFAAARADGRLDLTPAETGSALAHLWHPRRRGLAPGGGGRPALRPGDQPRPWPHGGADVRSAAAEPAAGAWRLARRARRPPAAGRRAGCVGRRAGPNQPVRHRLPRDRRLVRRSGHGRRTRRIAHAARARQQQPAGDRALSRRADGKLGCGQRDRHHPPHPAGRRGGA